MACKRCEMHFKCHPSPGGLFLRWLHFPSPIPQALQQCDLATPRPPAPHQDKISLHFLRNWAGWPLGLTCTEQNLVEEMLYDLRLGQKRPSNISLDRLPPWFTRCSVSQDFFWTQLLSWDMTKPCGETICRVLVSSPG